MIAEAPQGGPKPRFWRSFALFEDLPEPALAQLSAIALPQRWHSGEVLFQRGDPGDWMVALAEGRVKLTLLTAQGRELILRHAEGGDTLGEFALVDGGGRSADATAVTPTLGWRLPRARFIALAATHPALMLGAARYFCRRLRDTTDQLEGIALFPLEARLARFFLLTLRQIHGEDPPPRAALRLEISQGELAALLGASRPKVNRALMALQEAAAVTRAGEVWECDLPRLAALAEPEG
ncbi:Crp/Fnr family transcriptional regulator [Gemmobacter caeruleus]|uniref:Crp/Fnr family transcriptional regulator n=1 Tax=Gemmobacter caeruleus TaxID=2595004 RepID=UPI0011EDB7F8|nr:Crp/Fnr family transcriptional regulator [Gemmobacter caeruleus]